MKIDPTENILINNIGKHDTYSDEEKKFILQRLNDERLLEQKSKEVSSNITDQYSKEDKEDILNKINDDRRRSQKREEMIKKRTANKELYTFGKKKYFKFENMEREYYMEKGSCGKFSSRPSIVTLYYRTFGEMKRKDVLLKVEAHTEKIFISYDAIRVYFKPYTFEEKR